MSKQIKIGDKVMSHNWECIIIGEMKYDGIEYWILETNKYGEAIKSFMRKASK